MSAAKTVRVGDRDRDAGDTLVEILISVAILGIVGAALIGGFLTAITTSSDYRAVASSDTVLRTAVDTVTSQMQQNASAAFACPEDSSIYAVSDLPARYTSSVTALSYWVNGAAQTTCSAESPQLITLAVTYTNAAGKSSTNHATFAVNDPQAAPVNSGSGATKLVFLSQGGPSNSTAGSPFPNQPLVAVENSSGQIVTSDLSSMSLTLTPGTGTAGATLKYDPCTGSEFYGVVNYTGCEIDVAGTGYTLTATDGTLTAASPTFNVGPGPAATLVFSQSPGPASQAGTDASAFTDEPIIDVEDAYGNIVTSDSSAVTIAITSGTGTAGASLDSCTANPLHASSGIASFTGCGINKPGTGYTLTATDGSLTSATSTAFAIALGSSYQLVFTTEPVVTAGTQAGTGGTAFTNSGANDGQQPVVTIEDQAGNTVTTDNSTVTLQITSNTGTAGATLTCSPSNDQQTASAGVATFSGCAINSAGSGYTLTATDGTLVAATSTSFSIGVGPAAKLAFTTQPVSSAGAQAGTDATAFTQQPVVTVEDAGGNTVTSNSSSVTLAITSGTGTAGASLSCTTNPLAASAGVATFSGCGINKPGSGYTLKATDGALTSATSVNFSIGSGPAAKLVFTQSPVNSAGAQAGTGGIAWSQQPVVTVEDAAGYTVTSDSSSVTLAITSGTGTSGATLTCTPNPESAVAGVATFAGCKINLAGSGYTLKATDGTLTSATSLSFSIAVGPAASLTFTTEPPSSIGKGSTHTFSTSVTVEDAGGNAVAGSSVTISSSGSATLTCSSNTVSSNSSGVAAFTGCYFGSGTTNGTYHLIATDGSLTANSSNISVT
jgi:trimeric autotransporter adhesin